MNINRICSVSISTGWMILLLSAADAVYIHRLFRFVIIIYKFNKMNQKTDIQGLVQNVEQLQRGGGNSSSGNLVPVDKVFEGKIRYKQTTNQDQMRASNTNVMNINDPNMSDLQQQQNNNGIGGKLSKKGIDARLGPSGRGSGEMQQQQYSFREDDSESMRDTHVYKRLDSSLADRLLKEAQDELIQNYKRGDLAVGGGGTIIGSSAIMAASRDSGMSTEAIRNELRMLENKERQMDQFDQIQFGGEFVEIGKMAQSIDDVSIDSARVDLKERGGDDLDARMNLRSVIKNCLEDDDDDRKDQVTETPKQRRASAMRRGAGTGAGYDNAPRGKSRHGRGESDEKNQKNQSQSDRMGGRNQQNQQHQQTTESESCYINQSEIQSQPSQSQSQSVMTTERSHFTSIEGPPKVYEEIMRQLEADIRKHIRIEHQLKLHIESVEDRVEELEREQEDNEKVLAQAKEMKKLVDGLKEDIKAKDKLLSEKESAAEKQREEMKKAHQEAQEALQKQNNDLIEEMKKIREENANLQKNLKVSKSQNLRDQETIKKLEKEITTNEQQQQANQQAVYGPYQAALDDSTNNVKLHQKSNLFEFGGLSGVSGVSQVSANSALSSNNNLTRSQKNQHQFSQQMQQPYDRLSLSENRGQQVSQQMHQVPVNNYVNKHGVIDLQFNNNRVNDGSSNVHHQQDKQQDMPYKNPGQSYMTNVPQNQQITLMNQMINTQSSKNLTSLSEQNTILKKNFGTSNDSNTQSKLSIKQSNMHAGKQISQTIRQSKEKPTSNKYASCSPGIIKPTFAVGQSAQPTNTASKSNRVRSKKLQKHQSLEKFNNAALYGTQVVGAVNQSLIVAGTGNQLQIQNQQTGQFPNGPDVQIKMQSNQPKVEQAFIQNTDSMFKHPINLSESTPEKMKIKNQQMSNLNPRTNKGDNMSLLNNSNISSQQQRDVQSQHSQFTMMQQKANAENIQSSSESLRHQQQPNQQSRSHSQQNLYSQGQIQLQAQNKIIMAKGNNNVIINKQGNQNVLHFQNGSGNTGNNQSNNGSSLKKLTSNAQLHNIYRPPGNNTHSSGRSDALAAGSSSQTRSKSSKQQFRGNKNQSGSNNMATNFNSVVSVKGGNAQQIVPNSMKDTFYNSNTAGQGAAQQQTSSQQQRISIMQNQSNNSRNSILKIYNTVGPQIQKQNQTQYNSQKQTVGSIEQPQTVIRPVSSSKNSRKALAGLEMPINQIEMATVKESANQPLVNDPLQKRVLHQNLIYIGNQNMQKNAIINQTTANQKVKKQQSEVTNMQMIKVNVAAEGQQQYQVNLVAQNVFGAAAQQDKHGNLIAGGFVDPATGCDSASTGATGGTSTSAAIQRRSSSNNREQQPAEGQQQAFPPHHSGSSNNNLLITKVKNNQSINSSKSLHSKTKGGGRDRNNSKKQEAAAGVKPLTATVNSQSQSLNNTQKIRQASTKQPIASGGVIMNSQIVAGGPGSQSTKRSLSKNSQYTIGAANGHGPSPAPKTMAGKLSKMSQVANEQQRHQASSFRQNASSNKGAQSNSMTKSTSNLEGQQQHVPQVIRPSRTSSNPAHGDRQGSNKQRQVHAMKSALIAGGVAAHDKTGAKNDVSNLNSLYSQQSGLQQKQPQSQGQSQVTSNRGQFQPHLASYQTLLNSQAALVATNTSSESGVRLQSQSYKQIPQLPNNASIKGSTVNSRLGMHNNQ